MIEPDERNERDERGAASVRNVEGDENALTLDVRRLPFLLVGVTRFIALWHRNNSTGTSMEEVVAPVNAGGFAAALFQRRRFRHRKWMVKYHRVTVVGRRMGGSWPYRAGS